MTYKDLSREKKDGHNKKQRERRKLNNDLSTKKYEKTEKGFLMRLYRNMESRIKGVQKQKFYLYKDKELLSREDFYNWATDNLQFKELFKNYENSNYDRKQAPSVDRVNSDLGYTINNMEFVTMSENSRRGSLSGKNKRSKETI